VRNIENALKENQKYYLEKLVEELNFEKLENGMEGDKEKI
jgi:hypothetical protein